MRKHECAVPTLLLFAYVLLSACEQGDRDTSIPASATVDTVSVRLPWIKNAESAGLFLAQERGYYAQEGLFVTIVPGGVGVDPVSLVANKSTDFAIVDGALALIGAARGLPIRVVGAEFQESPLAFITLKESGITTIEQFRGKRIGVQPAQTFVLEAMLAANGMTMDDVRMTPVQFDVSPLLTKQVDAFLSFFTDQPILLSQRGIETNVIRALDNGYHFYSNAFIVHMDLTHDNPALIRRFLRASSRGWNDANANPAEAAALIVQRYNPELHEDHQFRSLVLLADLATMGLPEGALFHVSLTKWQAGAEALQRYGQIELLPDVSILVDTTFVSSID